MKLNQIVAIERGVKNKTQQELTKIHRALEKQDLTTGFFREYTPKDDDGEKFPSEQRRVQVLAEDELRRAGNLLTELFDVTATRDWGNCEAKADIVVDGKPLLTKVPTTYLLWLEKQLNDIHTLVAKVVTLDPSYTWNKDEGSGEYKTPPTETTKTKKVQKPIVLYKATDKHPAQTQLITEDTTVGTWRTTLHSGAMPRRRREEILSRVEKLQKAVKFAREEANGATVKHKEVGEAIFSYLFQ